MQPILVSFCNVAGKGPSLALLDPVTLDPAIIEVPDDAQVLGGIWGVVLTHEHVFATTTRYRRGSPDRPYDPSRLLIFDRASLDLVGQYEFQLGRDVHSLHLSEGTLYAVSTGTDEVLALRLDGGRVVDEQVFWRPDPSGERRDLHHLNAITTVHGELVISGFGKKVDVMWGTATEGFVKRLKDGEILASGLHHPHSPLDLGDRLAYCESGMGRVKIAEAGRSQNLDGYVRGACLANGSLYVGTSVGRRVSRSRGVLTNRGEPGETYGRCTVTRLNAQDLSIEASVDLSLYAQEIYDLVPVDGVEAWPRTTPLAWMEQVIRQARQSDEELEASVAWLHTEVAARDQQIRTITEELGALHTLAAEHDAAIRWLHDEVAQRDATITWLHQEVAVRDKTVAWLHQEVAARDATVAHLRDEG